MREAWKELIRDNRAGVTTVTLIGLIFIFGLTFTFMTDTFFSWRNMTNLMKQTAETGMIVITVSLILLSRDIDISMGSILGLTNIILGMLLKAGCPILCSCLLAVLAGGILGAVNGGLVAGLELPGMVATTGTMVLFRGLCMGITKGYPVSSLPDSFVKMARIRLLGRVPIAFFILVILTLLFHVMMSRTHMGLQIRAVGANRQTAEYSGIRTRKVKWMLFIMNGLMIGFAGIFLLSRMGSADANTGKSYDIDILASCLLGGMSLHGEGKGNILTVFLGLMGIAVIRNGFDQLAIPAIYQNMLLGILIALNAAKWKKETRQ